MGTWSLIGSAKEPEEEANKFPMRAEAAALAWPRSEGGFRFFCFFWVFWGVFGGFGFGVWVLGFGFWVLEFWVWGLGF